MNWYAWPHLISPATAAMNVVNRHLRIMESYLQAPHLHAEAVKNPKMLGGPFMDYETDQTEAIKNLRNATLTSQRKMIDFARAALQLAKILKEEAKGYSMDALYRKVPEILKGYVELVYDLNNQPSFRVLESLLYKSEFYDDSFQSMALYLINNDERPFILSTPRLPTPDVLHLKMPFKDSRIDDLFKMKTQPQQLSYIVEKFGIDSDKKALFDSFFTTEAPAAYTRYTGTGIRTRYFGHACILIEVGGVSILADPVISYGYNSDISRFTYSDLPDIIDFVLITHNHQDHILFETMLQIRHKVKHILVPRSSGSGIQDPNLKLMFNNLGFNNVSEISDLDLTELSGCTITGLPFFGEHADLNIQTKLCYLVKVNNFSILFMADSCNLEPRLYEHVAKIIGKVDVLFLGMECDGAPLSWLYGPLMLEPLTRDKDQSRRLAGSNYERARHIVSCFEPSEIFVYAMGQEPWLNYIMSLKYTEESNPIVASNRLIQECLSNGKNAERLFGEKELLYELPKALETI